MEPCGRPQVRGADDEEKFPTFTTKLLFTQTKLGKNGRIYWSTGNSSDEATQICLLIFCRCSG